MSAAPKRVDATAAKRPARPIEGKLDVAASHARIAKRYPKILAELAK